MEPEICMHVQSCVRYDSISTGKMNRKFFNTAQITIIYQIFIKLLYYIYFQAPTILYQIRLSAFFWKKYIWNFFLEIHSLVKHRAVSAEFPTTGQG